MVAISTVVSLVWVMGFTGVVLPLRFAQNKRLFSYATVFAAGVILSVATCHLLPDAAGDLASVTDYPLANFLCGLGLFIVLIVEKAFLGSHEAIIAKLRSAHRSGELVQPEPPVTPDEETPCLSASKKCVEPLNLDYGTDEPKECSVTEHHHHVSYTSKVFRRGLESGISLSTHMARNSPRACNTDCHKSADVNLTFEEKPTGSCVALTVMVVLSFHSIIEGMALGSAQETRAVFVLAVAILSHKFLAALSLGVSLLRVEIPVLVQVGYALFFSMMTPLGAMLGYILTDFLTAGHVEVFAAVMQSLGSGTFLYISLMEFLPEELSETSKDVTNKLFVCVLGYLAMGLIAVVV